MSKHYEFAKSVVNGTDWKILREQKKVIIELSLAPAKHNLTDAQTRSLIGITNFLDLIQDSVVDMEYLFGEEVFGYSCQKCGAQIEKEDVDLNVQALTGDIVCNVCAKKSPQPSGCPPSQCDQDSCGENCQPRGNDTPPPPASDVDAARAIQRFKDLIHTRTAQFSRRAPVIHELKTWPEYFEAIANHTKRFEMRSTKDRTFRPLDILYLWEYFPATKEYTGRVLVAWINYVLNGPVFDFPKDLCIIDIHVVELLDVNRAHVPDEPGVPTL